MSRILLVDDEIVISMRLEEVLTSMGYDVAGVAASGREAIEMARDRHPDLILMDIVMPGELDGIDAAAKIRSEIDIPVIFITGHAKDRLIERAKQVSPFGYILKPFQENQIKVVIEIALHKDKMEKQLQKAYYELEGRVKERTADLVKSNEELRRQIAERQVVEEKLRKSEEIAQMIINAPLDTASVLLDTDGNIISLNRTGAKQFRKSRTETIGLNVFDLLPSEVSKPRKIAFKKAIKSGKEVRYSEKIGRRWFDHSIYPALNPQGEVKMLIGFSRDITELKKTETALRERERALENKTNALNETNIALGVMLKKRESDKLKMQKDVLSNVKQLIEPYLKKLKKSQMDLIQESYLHVLDSNLKEITSPFIQTLSSELLNLTPTEIKVANLVKQGKTTKEIADITDSTKWAVDFHRNSMRRKLGIRNKKLNLRTYLLTFA